MTKKGIYIASILLAIVLIIITTINIAKAKERPLGLGYHQAPQVALKLDERLASLDLVKGVTLLQGDLKKGLSRRVSVGLLSALEPLKLRGLDL